MLDKNTIKKITKIQELLANGKDGVLVACYGSVDRGEMEFNTIVVTEAGAFVAYVVDCYDDYKYDGLVNVDSIYSIYLRKQVKEKLL